MAFWNRKDKKAEAAVKAQEARAKMQAFLDEGKAEYDAICSEVAGVLAQAGKPARCNTVRFASEPYLFPQLVSYQVFADWEIWRNGDTLYIYRAEVEDYPQDYCEADAPCIAQIDIADIQFFTVEGGIYTESKISGGKVTQDKRGRIHQTAIRSETINRDNRTVRVLVLDDGIVEQLEFEYSAYDVLYALIPEKEHA